GSIDWLCLPRFDSPSCFARLLGGEGHWQIAPSGEITEVRRSYRDSTLVLDTEFHTPTGVVRLTDAMLPSEYDTNDSPAIARMVQGVDGAVEMTLRWVVRFAYGHSTPWVRRVTDGGSSTGAQARECLLAVAGPTAITLHGDLLPVTQEGEHAHQATFTVKAGESLSWVLAYCPDSESPVAAVDAEAELAGAERFWRYWADRIDYTGPHADAVISSLSTLKGLTYQPTGGIIAAPTTSLPETPGGNRNWDYRYCWLRDATLTLLAMDNFNCTTEAAQWRRWLLRAVAGDPSELQIMYGLAGERHLLEWELDWLPGYQGAAPVRVGNAAYQQLQLDVYGELMDTLHLARERGHDETAESWALQRGLMKQLAKIWQQPDKSLWEVRGEDRHFTYSRVMVWVAFDRAVRGVEEDGLDGPVQQWRELRDAVRAEILEHGFNTELNSFVQYYGGTELDASTLRLSSVGFLAGDDPRMVGTVEAVGKALKRGDLVDRYTTGADASEVDGLSGQEGAFLM
ncbi:MAG: glycoside hydrolase family 15 protein, partial [Sciscionella sp.]